MPRELPGWLVKAAAGVFTIAIVPLVMAGIRRMDAGTARLTAEAELMKEQARTETARKAFYDAKASELDALHERIRRVEALDVEVTRLRNSVEALNRSEAEWLHGNRRRPPR